MLHYQRVLLFEKIRRSGGVALLVEVCHWEWALKFQEESFFLPMDQEVALKYCSSAHLCVIMLPNMMIMNETLNWK